MAKKPRPSVNTSAWMNTYSDLVTLLLCFFVLLYSMSVIDAVKWQEFAKMFRERNRDPDTVIINVDPNAEPGTPVEAGEDVDQPPEDPGDDVQTESDASASESPDLENPMPQDFDDLYDYLVAYIREQGMEDSVNITKGENTIYIRFNNNIFFQPDSAVLKAESLPVLDFLGDCLYSVEDQIYLININGHTASVDYEFYPVSSWTLSGERATNIAIYFEDNKGIDPKKLRPIGYSDNYPVAPNDTDENRRLNRRVDMVIVSNKAAGTGAFGELVGLLDPDAFLVEGGFDSIMTPGAPSWGSLTPQAPPVANPPGRTDQLTP